MSRVDGHFCFEALPSLLEQGGKTKMKVSESERTFIELKPPLSGISEANPALSAVKSNLLPKGAFFYCYMLSFINFKYFFIRIKHVF